MSKQLRVRIVAAICSLACAAALISGSTARAWQQRGIVAGTPTESREAAVVAATDEVLHETSDVRQLSIVRPVKSGTQNREEIERYVISNLNEESSPQRMHASEVTLKKMGLVPQNFDLRSFLIKLLTEQVAGYYNAKTREFYLADWIDLDGQKPVMAHELTHALQDQHFDLKRFDKWPKGESDSEMAFHALVEGDATLVMTFYMTRNPARAMAFLKSLATTGAGNSEQIDSAPRALKESLLFPYQQGMQWVAQVQKRDGWQGVSKAYKDLPASSEQILHPEKYFARETPVKISLPDVSEQLGNRWKRIEYDVNGEWGYFLILDQYLKAENESRRAAAGWGGDRYAVYEGSSSNDVVVTQMTAWDTEQDAIEFFNAYAKRSARRYEQVESVDSGKDSQDFKRVWNTKEGVVAMERRANRVLIVEGLSDNSRLPSITSKLWSKSLP
jgi:hypothetical protein